MRWSADFFAFLPSAPLSDRVLPKGEKKCWIASWQRGHLVKSLQRRKEVAAHICIKKKKRKKVIQQKNDRPFQQIEFLHSGASAIMPPPDRVGSQSEFLQNVFRTQTTQRLIYRPVASSILLTDSQCQVFRTRKRCSDVFALVKRVPLLHSAKW